MSGITRFYQIKQSLEARIAAGEFPVGAQLPSEPDLARHYGISKVTMSRALAELVNEGILVRRVGLGTFVLRQRGLPKKDAGIRSMTDEIIQAGLTPATEVLRAEQIPASAAPDWVREDFEIAAQATSQTTLYLIDRLRKASGRPVARQIIFLPTALFGDDLLAHADFTQSVFQLYARYGQTPDRAREAISFRAASPEEVELLSLRRPPYVYVVERRRCTYTTEQQVLECLISIDDPGFFQQYVYYLTVSHNQPDPAVRSSPAPR